ncbi:MAG: PQQ-binding-like beta-propeller repeat protein [Bryobacteraceae bacterium]
MKFAAILLAAGTAWGAPPDGAALYRTRCAACHDHTETRAPGRDSFGKMMPEFILKTMVDGAMAPQSIGLTPDERTSIARFLSGKEFGAAAVDSTNAGRCAAGESTFHAAEIGWNGWGADVENTRYQPHPGLTAADVPRLKLKWAFGFPGATKAFAQPVIAGGRLFTGSVGRIVYALDARTGCIDWTYDAGAGVRTAVAIGPAAGTGTVAFFGDLKANVHAVNAATGRLLWKTRVESHPVARITGSPVLYEGRLYVPVSSIEEAAAKSARYKCCTFRGSVVALDAATGRVIWKTYTIPETPAPVQKNKAGGELWGPAGAAVWSAPTIDVKRKRLYVGAGNSYTDVPVKTNDAIVAMDLATGRIEWARQVMPNDNFLVDCTKPGEGNCPEHPGPDYDFGASPILRSLGDGKDVIVAAQKSGMVYGLDPDKNGEILWRTRLGRGSALGGIQWGAAADLATVYAAVSDVVALPAGPAGGLHALSLATGAELWKTPAPVPNCVPLTKGCSGAQSAAVTAMPGVVFSGSIDGHLRGYSTKTGGIVWDFDTLRKFDTVNGVAGQGGSIDAAGPAIANGMVYTNSGYGAFFFGAPGNVLLAFSVDGK